MAREIQKNRLIVVQLLLLLFCGGLVAQDDLADYPIKEEQCENFGCVFCPGLACTAICQDGGNSRCVLTCGLAVCQPCAGRSRSHKIQSHFLVRVTSSKLQPVLCAASA